MTPEQAGRGKKAGTVSTSGKQSNAQQDHGAVRVDRIDLQQRKGDVSRHAPHHGIGYPRHCHEAIELNIVTAGRGAYIVDDFRVDLTPGRVLWLFPEQAHHLASATRLAYWIVYFSPEVIRRVGIKQMTNNEPLVHDVPLPHLRTLDACCGELMVDRQGPVADAGFWYLAHLAWRETVSGAALSSVSTRIDPAIQSVVTVLREGRGAPGLAEAARLAGLSGDRFARRFRSAIGCSYAAYRERVLIDRACAQWTAGDSWERLSAQVGFGSYRQFHRAFTSLTGVSPRAWARERD